MAHGFSATKQMVADRYAEVFTEAGLAVLLYDHRGFGASGGNPRQQVNPWVQARGYRDAIAFATTLDRVDPARIAVWGDSISSGAALVVAALDDRVAALVVQVPALGEELPPDDPDLEDVPEDIHESVLTNLLHSHLPKLADYGLIEYDARSGAIRDTDVPPLLEESLSLIALADKPDS